MAIRVMDMFCGISAFRSAAEKIGGFEFVGYCECDPTAIAAYRTLYDTRGEYFCNDARAMFFIVVNGNVLTGEIISPRAESECSLRDILIPDVPERYFLSAEKSLRLLPNSQVTELRENGSTTPEEVP